MDKDFKAFLERIKEDPAFAEAVKQAGDRIVKAEEGLGEGEILFRAGKELGYEFTLGDIDRKMAEEQELDDDELALAAGGGGVLDTIWDIIENITWCLAAAYYCAHWDK